jgi:hypothetical protein
MGVTEHLCMLLWQLRAAVVHKLSKLKNKNAVLNIFYEIKDKPKYLWRQAKIK